MASGKKKVSVIGAGNVGSTVAFHVAQQGYANVVLLDLHMPNPDGLEILRNLRSVRESLGFLPVIVLTGDTGRTARNSALLLGADDFLVKPLDRQEVVLRVRNLLRTRRLYVELEDANRAQEQKQKPR